MIKSLHLIRRRLRRLGVDVRPATPNLTDFIDDRKIDVVLDVGANVGQFSASLRNKGYRGKIVSFEPLASEFGRLAKLATSDGNWGRSSLLLWVQLQGKPHQCIRQFGLQFDTRR